jgi:hypothetical protein
MLFAASVSCKGVKPFRKAGGWTEDMQNFSFEAAKRGDLRQAGCAHGQDLIPERLIRHNIKPEVA